MSNEKEHPKKIKVNFEDIDFPKIFRHGTKINNILMKKFRDPVEAYICLKLLVYNLEESQGIKMTPEDEEQFKRNLLNEQTDDETIE